jgi:hypothetical protein
MDIDMQQHLQIFLLDLLYPLKSPTARYCFDPMLIGSALDAFLHFQVMSVAVVSAILKGEWIKRRENDVLVDVNLHIIAIKSAK